jgi:chlorite dismutase
MKKSTKTWMKAAGIRAAKTFAQAAIAAIGTAIAMNDVNWLVVLSIAGLAAVLSVLTSVAGLPEAPIETDI